MRYYVKEMSEIVVIIVTSEALSLGTLTTSIC
jgi:hypothetical protein